MSEEVFPVVTVDRRLGESASSVDVDYDLVGEYLKNRGLSDEEIAETHILISARAIGTESEYDLETGRVTVYSMHRTPNNSSGQPIDYSDALASALEFRAIDVLREQPTTGELVAKAAKASLGAAAIFATCAALRSIASIDTSSNSMKHHLVRHATARMAGRALGSSVFKEAIAAIHPHEIQSKKAGKNAPSGLLTITPKK